MTRRFIWSTMPASWVAMSTVVPPALIRSSTAMMPALVAGSRFPVGSSASSTCRLVHDGAGDRDALLLTARELVREPLRLARRGPTILSTSGTASWMKPRDLPITCRVKATFSKTVLFGSSRKSWNTTPMLRRKYGTLRLRDRAEVLAEHVDLALASASPP